MENLPSLIPKFKRKTALSCPVIKQQHKREIHPSVVLAGEGVGEIDAIEPAYDIIQRIDEEAQQVIQSMSSILGETSKRKRN